MCRADYYVFQFTARHCNYMLNPDYVAVWLPEMRAVLQAMPPTPPAGVIDLEVAGPGLAGSARSAATTTAAGALSGRLLQGP